MTSKQAIAEIEAMSGPGTYYQKIIKKLEDRVHVEEIRIGPLKTRSLALNRTGPRGEENHRLKKNQEARSFRNPNDKNR